MLRFLVLFRSLSFSTASFAKPDELTSVSCTFEDLYSKIEVDTSMVSKTKFYKEAVFSFDGDIVVKNLVQKPPLSGEEFYLIFGENDPLFTVKIQIFHRKNNIAPSMITHIFNGKKDIISGNCEFF